MVKRGIFFVVFFCCYFHQVRRENKRDDYNAGVSTREKKEHQDRISKIGV